ncbi:MAG: hypothetical protein KGJ78_14065 [Alphaproteobacteria bacterium]|nr:hypothetical protein [Alphaproteobacteria bacterium]
MRTSKRVIISALAALGIATTGAAAEGVTVVNDPTAYWGVWGPAKTDYLPDPNVAGGQILRITISPKPANPWDVGTYAQVIKPLKQGDVVLMSFWARAERPPAGNDFITVSGRIYENKPQGIGVSPETGFMIGREWKKYYASGTAAKDLPAGTVSVGMIIGTGDQVIDFGQLAIVDYGPDYDLAKLPHN